MQELIARNNVNGIIKMELVASYENEMLVHIHTVPFNSHSHLP